MFLIIVNPDEKWNEKYKGALYINKDIPYFVTKDGGPTFFATEKEAEKAVEKSKKKIKASHYFDYFLKANWQIVDIDFYRMLIVPGGVALDSIMREECEWLKKLIIEGK